jgi:hypothetical protein
MRGFVRSRSGAQNGTVLPVVLRLICRLHLDVLGPGIRVRIGRFGVSTAPLPDNPRASVRPAPKRAATTGSITTEPVTTGKLFDPVTSARHDDEGGDGVLARVRR